MITGDDIKSIRPGDYITFKSATRSGYRKAKRKVKEIDSFGRPTVGYHGWSDFVVMPHEVLEIHKAAPAPECWAGCDDPTCPYIH